MIERFKDDRAELAKQILSRARELTIKIMRNDRGDAIVSFQIEGTHADGGDSGTAEEVRDSYRFLRRLLCEFEYTSLDANGKGGIDDDCDCDDWN